jgi:hypothetical protein
MMMRKLLVLALVLSVVGLANAGLSTTNLVPDKLDAVVDTVAQTITFVGYNTTGANAIGAITGLALNIILSPIASDSAITYNLAQTLPATWSLTGEGFEIAAGDWVCYGGNSTNGVVGTLAVFGYAGAPVKATLYSSGDWGNAEVGIRGSAMTSLDGKVITIPEPMTMLLLGLGGLFLRKK